MKYKILLVSHSSECSGAPRVLLDIAGCLSLKDYDLTLCTPEPGGVASIAEEKALKVKIIPNPQLGFRNEKNLFKKFKILYQRLCFMRNFRREIKNRAYDLVYLNSSASLFAGLALLGLHVKIIWHIHEDLVPSFLNRLKCRLIAKLSHFLVFVSPSNLPCFAPYLSGKQYQILPNGIQMEKMTVFTIDHEYHKRFDYKAEDNIVAMISFVSKRKGVDIFLKSLCHVLPGVPNAKGVVAGSQTNSDPGYLKELETLRSDPVLKDRVFFPGHCANIPSFLKCVHVLALPSRNDPMPLVLLEAMAAGKAIVAADVGGVREMLDPPNCGIVVPPENPEILAEEIGKLLIDPERRRQLGQNARKRALQNYSMETFCKKISNLIKSVLG
jgi:glycosyltransferase involved in cell wall biosynthesis